MSDTERLFVLLEARISDFEKKMAAAERRGTKTYTALQKGSTSATRAMEGDMVRASGRVNQALAQTSTRIGAVGVAFRGFLAGAAVAGATEIVRRVGDIARSVAEVGNEAKRAGVSAQAFQEWKYVAEQNRIGVDEMVDGLKELSLRADEFVTTGGGAAAESFARLGYSAEELRDKLKDPSALLLEIIGRLGDMDRAAQIRVADELFGGTAGERFVEMLGQGEASIRSTMDQAHQLGLVMSDELIEKAADLDAMFSSISATVGTTLKSAIVSAAASLVDFLRLWRSYDQQRSQSLESQLNDTIRQRAQLVEEQKGLQAGDEGLSENAKKLGFGTGSVVNQEKIGQLQARIDKLTATEDEIISVLQSRTVIPEPTAPDSKPWSPPAKGGSAPGGGGGGRRGGSGGVLADDFQREVAAILRRTDALKAATAAQEELNPALDDYGLASETAAAKADLLAAAQAAGLEITPELRREIEALAEGYGKASAGAAELDERQQKVNDRIEEIRELRKDTTRGLVDDLLEGKSAAEAFANALARVGDKLLDMAFDDLFAKNGPLGRTSDPGSGGLGSILGAIGSLVGFADGTPNTGGRRGQVRGIVHAQEAVIPLPSGGKVPVQLQGATSPQAGGGGGKTLVEVSLSPDLVGAIIKTAGEHATTVSRAHTQALAKQVPNLVANAARRIG